MASEVEVLWIFDSWSFQSFQLAVFGPLMFERPRQELHEPALGASREGWRIPGTEMLKGVRSLLRLTREICARTLKTGWINCSVWSTGHALEGWGRLVADAMVRFATAKEEVPFET